MASDDRGLYKWLTNVSKFGFSFVSGVPATPEATEELSTRIGFIRETQYGKFWDFTSDLSIGDTAYTTLALGAHTDNTYFTDPSGLQLFHLLSHTNGSGGAALLVDGFYAASIMKELHPKAYDLLSRVRVPAHAAGEPGALYTPFPEPGYPVLGHEGMESAGAGASGGEGEEDDRGELVQVRWNNDDRSVMKGLKADVVEEWYEAIRELLESLHKVGFRTNLGIKDSEIELLAWIKLRGFYIGVFCPQLVEVYGGLLTGSDANEPMALS